MTFIFHVKDLDHINMRDEIRRARLKNKVLKQYPNAKPVHSVEGVQIMSDGIFIAEEFYMPGTNCIETAWEYAGIACRTAQNFNRTHPMKMDLGDIESKINRINKRRGPRRKINKKG